MINCNIIDIERFEMAELLKTAIFYSTVIISLYAVLTAVIASSI